MYMDYLQHLLHAIPQTRLPVKQSMYEFKYISLPLGVCRLPCSVTCVHIAHLFHLHTFLLFLGSIVIINTLFMKQVLTEGTKTQMQEKQSKHCANNNIL